MPQNKLKVAVIQAGTVFGDLEATLNKLESFVRQAKAQDASFAVFPEALIGGYPKGSTFGTVIGSRSPEGRDEFVQYHNGAISLAKSSSDPSAIYGLRRLEAIAKESDIFLVGGVIEKDGGTLYCTAVYIDPEKGLIEKHRKLMPTAAERLVWGQGGADTINTVEKRFGQMGEIDAKISATICWENYMPALRYHYYKQHVNLYTAPTVDSRPGWISTMTHIAMEGRTFVLSACQFATRDMYPPDHKIDQESWTPESSKNANGDRSKDVFIAGGSCIVAPLGEMLAGPLREQEGVLTAEIDFDECVRGKFDCDVVGHYARSDIFEFKVKGS